MVRLERFFNVLPRKRKKEEEEEEEEDESRRVNLAFFRAASSQLPRGACGYRILNQRAPTTKNDRFPTGLPSARPSRVSREKRSSRRRDWHVTKGE